MKLQKSQEIHHRILQRQFTNEAKNVEHDREIPKERSQKIKQKIIDELRFI